MTSTSNIRRIALTTAIGCVGLAASTSPASARPIDFRPTADTGAPHARQVANTACGARASTSARMPDANGIDALTLRLIRNFG